MYDVKYALYASFITRKTPHALYCLPFPFSKRQKDEYWCKIIFLHQHQLWRFNIVAQGEKSSYKAWGEIIYILQSRYLKQKHSFRSSGVYQIACPFPCFISVNHFIKQERYILHLLAWTVNILEPQQLLYSTQSLHQLVEYQVPHFHLPVYSAPP